MSKWIAFWLLGLIWGSSYVLIHIGVKELSPFQLVFIRTAIGAVGMNLMLLIYHKHLPTQWNQIWPLLLIGVGNTTVPFVLVSWGGQSVEAGLASILQTTEAFFVLLIAHFVFEDERITSEKALGTGMGFIGVIIITSPTWSGGGLQADNLAALVAIIVAQLFYAVFVIYSRQVINSGVEPMILSSGSMSAAAVTAGAGMIFVPMVGGQPATPLTHLSSDTLIAVLILGVVNTFIAYQLSYWTLQQIGPSKFGMITYVILAVGVALGVIILGETFTWELVLGAAFILAGVAISSLDLHNLYHTIRCEFYAIIHQPQPCYAC